MPIIRKAENILNPTAKTTTGATGEMTGAPSPLRAPSTLTLLWQRIAVLRFLFVSTVSTVVDYRVLFLLIACLPKGRLMAFIAVGAGYTIGTVVNFVMARRMVFHPTDYATHVEFIFVAAVAGVGLVLTEWITLTLNEHLHWPLFFAKTAAVVIVFFWNFLARRKLIYRKK